MFTVTDESIISQDSNVDMLKSRLGSNENRAVSVVAFPQGSRHLLLAGTEYKDQRSTHSQRPARAQSSRRCYNCGRAPVSVGSKIECENCGACEGCQNGALDGYCRGPKTPSFGVVAHSGSAGHRDYTEITSKLTEIRDVADGLQARFSPGGTQVLLHGDLDRYPVLDLFSLTNSDALSATDSVSSTVVAPRVDIDNTGHSDPIPDKAGVDDPLRNHLLHERGKSWWVDARILSIAAGAAHSTHL